jgi:hypothetical protein
VVHSPKTSHQAGGSHKPISKSTLGKAFRSGLAAGKAGLKAKIVSGFHAALDERQAWAVCFGLRAIIGLRDGASVPQQAPEPGDEQRPTIQVTFVKPNWGPDDDDPLPRQIEQGPVHYDKAPAGRRLLPAPSQQPMPDLSKRRSWMD